VYLHENENVSLLRSYSWSIDQSNFMIIKMKTLISFI